MVRTPTRSRPHACEYRPSLAQRTFLQGSRPSTLSGVTVMPALSATMDMSDGRNGLARRGQSDKPLFSANDKPASTEVKSGQSIKPSLSITSFPFTCGRPTASITPFPSSVVQTRSSITSSPTTAKQNRVSVRPSSSPQRSRKSQLGSSSSRLVGFRGITATNDDVLNSYMPLLEALDEIGKISVCR